MTREHPHLQVAESPYGWRHRDKDHSEHPEKKEDIKRTSRWVRRHVARDMMMDGHHKAAGTRFAAGDGPAPVTAPRNLPQQQDLPFFLMLLAEPSTTLRKWWRPETPEEAEAAAQRNMQRTEQERINPYGETEFVSGADRPTRLQFKATCNGALFFAVVMFVTGLWG